MSPREVTMVVAVAVMLTGCRGASRAPDADALRRTRCVEIFDTCKESVVRITATRVEKTQPPEGSTEKPKTTTHTQWASGCVLHEAGYVLSNSHMLRFEGERKAMLDDGTSFPLRVIAVDEPQDLVLLKMDADRPLKPLRLGRSRDVLVGEPAITLGNPFGMGLTIAAGIISGLGRATTTEYTHLTDMIQTDASINPGSSGGPLLNILGECIGLCTSHKSEGENIGLAIPIDKVRSLLPDIVAAEERYGFVLGLRVDPDSPATVTDVKDGSPADRAGVKVGDAVSRIDGEPIRGGIGFCLALIERQGGQTLALGLLRDGRPVEAAVTLGTVEPRQAESIAGLVNGLSFKHYHGRWSKLPDFRRLRPVASGTIATFDLGQYKGKDQVGLVFEGYIEVPADGVYAFYTRSDDGSRLSIGGQLVVDNDGLHAAAEKRGFVSLKAGKHPITVTFFEATGDDELKVCYEGPGLAKTEVPASALYRAGTDATP